MLHDEKKKRPLGLMEIVYLNSHGGLGGAERCLLDLFAGLPAEIPGARPRLVCLSRGALVAEAEKLGIKAGPMFQPVRVAVCGRKNAPPLFDTLTVLGRETCLNRIDRAIALLP